MDPKTEAEILATPARDLTALQVRQWYGAAFASEPTYAQVAWLLPRIFELLAECAEVAAVGNEVAFQRLRRTGFPVRWPDRQVAAINCFAVAYLDLVVSKESPHSDDDLDRVLCMFGEGGIDLGPLLDRLNALSDDDLATLLHKNWFYHGWGVIPQNHFWSQEPGISFARNWYVSKALLSRMEKAAMDGNEKALDVYTLIAISGAQAKA
ncbi:hypothetical protein ACSBLW_17205 [Thioclava sp. FR2]|uniref:hypothetical protein n=1 Tax=Thioclava sp. FR2 TaxID=3445780 RepID=UPI003EBFD8D6